MKHICYFDIYSEKEVVIKNKILSQFLKDIF